ncbi:MAG: hypothetical protein Q9213_000736 [Squamulea squamosa]
MSPSSVTAEEPHTTSKTLEIKYDQENAAIDEDLLITDEDIFSPTLEAPLRSDTEGDLMTDEDMFRPALRMIPPCRTEGRELPTDKNNADEQTTSLTYKPTDSGDPPQSTTRASSPPLDWDMVDDDIIEDGEYEPEWLWDQIYSMSSQPPKTIRPPTLDFGYPTDEEDEENFGGLTIHTRKPYFKTRQGGVEDEGWGYVGGRRSSPSAIQLRFSRGALSE